LVIWSVGLDGRYHTTQLDEGFPVTEQAPSISRHDLEAKIVKRCWEDEGFRQEFTADPAGAFVRYLEVPAMSLPKIVVCQEEPGSWHIVLPAKPAGAGELSEADLERVAGASGSIFGPGATAKVIPVLTVMAASGAGSAVGTVAGAFSIEQVTGW
jgi:hypothetical protein